MGTELPAELVGTAIVRLDADEDGKIVAYETAMRRLHDAALRKGVFVGEPVLHVENAPTHMGDYHIYVLAAPVLDTGTDEKIEHTHGTIDDPWPDQAP